MKNERGKDIIRAEIEKQEPVKVAKYYAHVKESYIQVDIHTGQLEIYENPKGFATSPIYITKSSEPLYAIKERKDD